MMRNLIHALIIIASLPSTSLYACICSPQTLKKIQPLELEKSECIFIGEVTNVNFQDNTYKITVLESLDGGDSIGNTYIGKNWKYCYPYADKEGKWLIYGKTEEGFLRINICGISRSFSSPEETINSINPPLPSRNIVKKEQIDKAFKKWKEENKKQAQIDLKNEIIALRERRDNKIFEEDEEVD